jgi:hypothetical protein
MQEEIMAQVIETGTLEPRKFVYRLLDAEDRTLYVGQHYGIHAITRILDHRKQHWWRRVARWEIYEITGDLDAAELHYIEHWDALFNVMGQPRLPRQPMPAGRPKSYTPAVAAEVLALRETGVSLTVIASRVGLSRRTVSRVVADARPRPRRSVLVQGD